MRSPSIEAMTLARKTNRAKVNLIVAYLIDDAERAIKEGIGADPETQYALAILRDVGVMDAPVV